MRNFIGSIMGAAMLVAPSVAFAQSDLQVSPPVSAGMWSAGGTQHACILAGGINGQWGLMLEAQATNPSVFTLLFSTPNPPSTNTVTFNFGNGVVQTLVGTPTTDVPNTLTFTLDNSAENNFATFLHGFTAGTEMSVAAGTQAVDFNLAGTSDAVSGLGKCTDMFGYNNLPLPWRPASEQTAVTPVYPSSAPVTYSPPAPTAYDIYVTDGSAPLPDCNDPQSFTLLGSTIEGIPGNRDTYLRVLSVDHITPEITQSGRQLCHASVFTSQGPQDYDFQWLAHNGNIYIYARAN